MKVSLSNKALEFLRDMLAAPGWVKTDNVSLAVKRNYFASKLVAEVLPEVAQLPLNALLTATSSAADARVFDAALKTLNTTKCAEFEVDDKSLEVCQVCMKHFIHEGKTPSGAGMVELIDLFKLLD